MKISLLLINLILIFQCLGFILFQIWLKDELDKIYIVCRGLEVTVKLKERFNC